MGLIRDPVAQYIVLNNNTQARSSYFWTRFGKIDDAVRPPSPQVLWRALADECVCVCIFQISTFLYDYPNALARSRAFDAQLKSDAGAISADYAAIVALSIRQAFGGIEITVSKNHDGSFDSSNTLTFMKGASIPIAAAVARARSSLPVPVPNRDLDLWRTLGPCSRRLLAKLMRTLSM